MAQFKDVRGLSWTAGNEVVAQNLFAIFDSFLTYRADVLDRLNAILDEDPECPSAWILKGFLFISARSLSLLPQARDTHARAASLSQQSNPREQLHAKALKHWVEGDLRGAQLVFDRIATEHPHDLLALRLQHVNAIFFGRPDVLRTTVTRTLSDWDDSVPGAGIVYGMACMGLEEVGEYERAEKLGKRGVELEPDDLWAIHSVSHVLEAQGRLKDGIEWMKRPDSYWDGRGPMRHHLWWHEALFMFEAADYEGTLSYFDDRLAPAENRPGYLEMSNCASLLFRLEVAGQDCGERWNTLIQRCNHLVEDRALTFSDIHMIVALTMARKGSALERMAREISDYAASGGAFDRVASGKISVPLAKAMQARLSGDPQSATDTLLDARFDFQFMGGSIAQRDMLDILLIDCAMAAGRKRLTRRLLNEYRDARPHSVPIERMAQRFVA
jgi:tetratricopeptide (TPR) repeat protein